MHIDLLLYIILCIPNKPGKYTKVTDTVYVHNAHYVYCSTVAMIAIPCMTCLLDHWTSPRGIGERPPPCAAFTFSPFSGNSGVMFGGLVPAPDRLNNDVFVAEVVSANTVVRL